MQSAKSEHDRNDRNTSKQRTFKTITKTESLPAQSHKILFLQTANNDRRQSKQEE